VAEATALARAGQYQQAEAATPGSRAITNVVAVGMRYPRDPPFGALRKRSPILGFRIQNDPF
jgi:hypothetical protein